MSDPELEQFKTAINLTAYAAAQGYQLMRRESSRNSVVMKHTNGDKIIIAKSHDNHWVYFSVRDDTDNGSIIDFVQKRKPCSLGQVRKALRDWIGTSPPYPAPDSYMTEVRKSTKDRQTIMANYGKMQDVSEHPYLKTRCIDQTITGDPRFAGRVRLDRHGNAIFPHYDEEGLCGYEIKNRNFTGFAAGGEKVLWVSRCFTGDDKLVFTESAIDALSFHALQGDDKTRYLSTAGGWSDKTVSLMQKAVNEFAGSTVILAFDHDDQGRIYAEKASDFLSESGKIIETMFPVMAGDDWNDQLRKQVSSTPVQLHLPS